MSDEGDDGEGGEDEEGDTSCFSGVIVVILRRKISSFGSWIDGVTGKSAGSAGGFGGPSESLRIIVVGKSVACDFFEGSPCSFTSTSNRGGVGKSLKKLREIGGSAIWWIGSVFVIDVISGVVVVIIGGCKIVVSWRVTFVCPGSTC